MGYSPNMALILASVAFTQYAVFSWPPYFYIDRIGRRWFVMLSSGSCAICMAIIAGGLARNSFSSAAAAVAFIFLYLDCFTSGILPVSWSYSSEIQPLRVRNKATADGVLSHWISNFVVVMVTPIGLNAIKGNYFWVWAVICASFVPLTYFFGVETSWRTLEQIDAMFCNEPRLLMGLNPESRKVMRGGRMDEEQRYRDLAHANEKKGVVMAERVSESR
jgi:MFS family permease